MESKEALFLMEQMLRLSVEHTLAETPCRVSRANKGTPKIQRHEASFFLQQT